MHNSAPNTTSRIFELIQSLTKSEVRYFRSHSRRSTDNEQTYLTVFNKILNTDTYDEERLARRVRITVKNLRVVNTQLYNRIIDKLHEFHLENSIEERVKKDLHLIKILLEKNLQSHISRILDRTRKTIVEYELFEQLPDLLKIEQLIWDKNGYKGVSESDIHTLHGRMIEGLEQQKNLSLYQTYRCIVRKAHFDKIRLDEDIKFIPDEAFQSSGQATSLRAKIEYYKILATYYFMTGNGDMALKHSQESVKIYEENSKLIELFPKDYIITLNYYLIDSLSLGRDDEFNKGLKKIEDLLEQDPFKKVLSLKSKAFEILYRLKFNRIITDEDFKAGLELIKEFEPLFKKYRSEIPMTPQITFCYMVAYIFFVNKQYGESLKWLNEITQKKPNTAQEICLFARSLELVVYYERGHIHLDKLIVNAHNYIKGVRGKLYESEKQLFALLRELHKTPRAEAERKAVFEKHLPDIKALKLKREEARFFGHFDLLRWIQSKLED